ncbi:poly(ADP-ribose) polymerase [Trypanosoma theileri]|uniref:Poly [ADP-ribose] polymerase n=1 Tax=Trypanosoma theileri TaxID=67003 RepID=A0A1X0NFA1_9TRYP|nr:poly(ADP-ribose) polymerase [Trypanosoma theileri]ORC82980.1 poly(ADP-ribose) polymerase [Trypanosoma theileri]
MVKKLSPALKGSKSKKSKSFPKKSKSATKKSKSASKKSKSTSKKGKSTSKKGTRGNKSVKTASPIVASSPLPPSPSSSVVVTQTSAATDKGGVKRQRLLQKGRGVVDPFSGKADSCHVYENGEDLYQCTLNQTNISSNNNKYYILQLLEPDHGGPYYVFTRWGRVGISGQNKTECFSNVQDAVRSYCKKFYEKTRNCWSNRANFKKVEGQYYLMDIDYGAEEVEKKDSAQVKKKKKMEKKEVVESALPKELQYLMRLIGNKDNMTQTMRELDINTDQMPLGKISKPQILRAYEVLKGLEKELKKPRPKLEEMSGQFYTLIPHVFGNRKPPVIDSMSMLRKKMEMLETLGELEIAATLLETNETEGMHPLDSAYKSLNCEIRPLPQSDPAFKRIVEYASNTQGLTHNSYTLEVTNVFTVKREGEEKRFKSFKKLGNRQMLWHGSRVTNFMGILSQGLRIAPPEAPSTGYMFGKGIYLADVCSKSANYCYPAKDTKTGLMLLCEAALGKQEELYSAQYMEKPVSGKNATKGVGRMYPDPAGAEVVDGILWPKGKLIVNDEIKTHLIYPEHIIYDVGQCTLRYLVMVKFCYK